MSTHIHVIMLAIIVALGLPVPASHGEQQQETGPEKVTLCQLKSNPAAYNHKLVEVTGFMSHGFEDSTLFDPSCPSWPDVWLEYGGTVSSGTMYCCGVTADRSRPNPLTIEKTVIPLTDDDRFREFDRLLHLPPDSVVHATIVGRFFSGKEVKYPKGTSWGGYGHMGCCSLFAIQQVISVDPHDRNDLDYGSSTDQPDINKAGCGFRYLTSLEPWGDVLEAQRRTELGETQWALTDPRKVAADALAHLLNQSEEEIKGLKEKRNAQGRIVYQWHPKARGARYMVVVSRPYWLLFYAKDPKKLAWVVRAAYESSCGEAPAVRRIH